jgi:triosephosphate isomerase (TIM)
MKNLIIGGNWKSNMTKDEALGWFERLAQETIPENIEVIIFAPYTLLDVLSAFIKERNLKIKLGSQNVSRFPKGAHTGEIYANQIKEFAQYSLIGHSERRRTFGETDEIVNKKIEAAMNVGIKPVVCVSSLDQLKSIYADIIIAYEPIDAIGTGNPELPNDVERMAQELKSVKNAKLIYGGSINSDNIRRYTDLENMDGVLIGMDSLNVDSFIKNINNAS